MSINKDKLLACFERMYNEHWTYELGAAREGCVDCSGAFVYAYKQQGATIEHGSNAIARKRVGDMLPLSKAQAGYATFKWRADGAPDTYTDGKGNYYHIGLVDATGAYVLNAKGAAYGFSRDALKEWSCVARLKTVNYDSEVKNVSVLYQAVVTTQNTSLNVRESAGSNGKKIGSIPLGATVDVLEEVDADGMTWMRVEYDGLSGYACGVYLTRIETGSVETESDADDSGAVDTVNISSVKIVDDAGNVFIPHGNFHVYTGVVD